MVGRTKWMAEQGIVIDQDETEVIGMSVVGIARNGKLMGMLGFRDKIRAEAADTIKELKNSGIRLCAMVTGDRAAVASEVAKTLGIDDYLGDCLPEGKVEYVEKVKKDNLVAFVGDGVNDAPALAAGNLSIAMRAIGSDIAINSASIALMNNDLRRIPLLISLSRKMSSVISQNLAFGMIFVIGGIILSVFGELTPVVAAIFHTVSTLIVIFNSARLVRTGEMITLAEKKSEEEQK